MTYLPVNSRTEPMSKDDPFIQARLAAPLMKSRNHSRPQIEKGIPVPGKKHHVAKHDHFYPFEAMEVGDSFWVEGDKHCTSRAVSIFTAKTGWKFITRGQLKDGRANKFGHAGRKKDARGQRIWRVL